MHLSSKTPKRHSINSAYPRCSSSQRSNSYPLARAQQLDQELQAGRSRGPLHGIHVVVKVGHYLSPSACLLLIVPAQDCIATALDYGMPTTVGSIALLKATKPTKNAPIVQRV